jgi:glycerol kinase
VAVSRPHFQETTALGAALAAGLAVGFYSESFVLTHPPNNSTAFMPGGRRLGFSCAGC